MCPMGSVKRRVRRIAAKRQVTWEPIEGANDAAGEAAMEVMTWMRRQAADAAEFLAAEGHDPKRCYLRRVEEESGVRYRACDSDGVARIEFGYLVPAELAAGEDTTRFVMELFVTMLPELEEAAAE